MNEQEELRLECVHIAAALYIATLEAGHAPAENVIQVADRLASFVLDERPTKGAH
jgi:hypothetical protein